MKILGTYNIIASNRDIGPSEDENIIKISFNIILYYILDCLHRKIEISRLRNVDLTSTRTIKFLYERFTREHYGVAHTGKIYDSELPLEQSIYQTDTFSRVYEVLPTLYKDNLDILYYSISNLEKAMHVTEASVYAVNKYKNQISVIFSGPLLIEHKV